MGESLKDQQKRDRKRVFQDAPLGGPVLCQVGEACNQLISLFFSSVLINTFLPAYQSTNSIVTPHQ